MDYKDLNVLDPELKVITELEGDGKFTIGLPANYADDEETRFLLTPEACGLITSAGLKIKMEADAGIDISFSDDAYAEYGVEITDRDTVLKADLVLSFCPLKKEDVMKMRKGTALLCMMGNELFKAATIEALLERNITCGVLDNMYSSYNDEPVFANVINEIDGRAAILYAQEHLSYLGGGKGVLLAGVAGINPCEVLIIGEGMDVCYAAKAAIAAGATVTLVNNDISALQTARQFCGEALTTIAIHPRVLYNKCKTADVLILGETTRPFTFPNKLNRIMKDSAFVLNFKDNHPSAAVPRTVAMGLSNVLVNFLDEMVIKNGLEGMIMTSEGVQCGIITYHGTLVDKLIASYLSKPSVDIKIMLTAKN
ncbi:MAG: hypothetical protein HDS25_07805 [Bacteroides sp.]|nr:hypothetical protein [Bacteroides sp.]MDE6236197.1 hypothetical protein [Muribaculaceae bacterium]